ncbi:MAG: hypothetical protein KatS3mg129_2688 [Leptospiraceae bacterium]|nr:MAG: hypothetical protein KatS3mg129_2688 [Leptospiraceae bacterium]
MKLPIGIQSFEVIRTGNYYYVDKTKFVWKLVNDGKYYFLSRPRRFGKSLFIDTLKQAFLGRKELFRGLYLEDRWDWEKKYPVIHIDFGGGLVKDSNDLEEWIKEILISNYKEYQIEQDIEIDINKKEKDIRLLFKNLIIKLYKNSNSEVVVLIDEYDKPILDRIEDKEEAIKIREVLKNFYSVLKPLDRYLKFVILTGVSKFSKVSLFSGLNQLRDITLSEEYATICGYTQEELEEVFKEELRGEDREEIRRWYNGYSWLGDSGI